MSVAIVVLSPVCKRCDFFFVSGWPVKIRKHMFWNRFKKWTLNDRFAQCGELWISDSGSTVILIMFGYTKHMHKQDEWAPSRDIYVTEALMKLPWRYKQEAQKQNYGAEQPLPSLPLLVHNKIKLISSSFKELSEFACHSQSTHQRGLHQRKITWSKMFYVLWFIDHQKNKIRKKISCRWT